MRRGYSARVGSPGAEKVVERASGRLDAASLSVSGQTLVGTVPYAACDSLGGDLGPIGFRADPLIERQIVDAASRGAASTSRMAAPSRG